MSQEDSQYSKMTPAERHEEYLQLLREKNRIKRHLSGKSKQESANEERERGFSTHFAGANASDTKVQKKKVVTGAGKLKLGDITAPKVEKSRRRWGTDAEDNPAGGKGVQMPLGEWGRPRHTGADRRWSLGSGTGSQEGDDVPEEYEEEYEEDFEEVLETAPSAADSDARKLQHSAPQISAPASEEMVRSSSGGIKPKIRTEKEVIRLNSASGVRPQSLGLTAAPSDLNALVLERPVSNQSVLRGSGAQSKFSPSTPSTRKNTVDVPLPTKAVSPPRVTSQRLLDDDADEVGRNPANVSSILDTSLVEKVSDLDDRQREKLLNLLMAAKGDNSNEIRGAIAPDGPTTPVPMPISSPRFKNSTGSSMQHSLGATSSDIITPRTLNLSQMATLPMLKQDPVPGAMAIQSAIRTEQEATEAAMDLSISGMSAMFKTAEIPLTGRSEDFSPATSGLGASYLNQAMTTKLSTVRESADSLPAETMQRPINVNCRIRIHNGWSEDKLKKRFVSLRHIGLRLAGSSTELDVSTLDITLFCGLTPLSKASEATTTVRRLFAVNSRIGFAGNEEWRGPYDTGNPLEIRLSGTVFANASDCESALCASDLTQGSLSSDVLELVICNGLSLPARDADVYNGQRCIWSGCFDQLLNSVASHSSRPDVKALEPTLFIIPLRQKLRGATNKPRSEAVPKADTSIDAQSLGGPPVWLSAREGDGNTASPLTADVANAIDVLRKSVQSKRRTDDLIFESANNTDQSAASEMMGPMPRLDSAKPKSSHSNARRQKKKEDDDALRQSLDALEQSNRSNRGRLVSRRRAAEESNLADPILQSGGIVITKKDADNIQKKEIDQQVADKGETLKVASSFEEIAEVAIPIPQYLKQEHQDRRLQKRSEKIDQVQESVRSALANLAGVMASMPSRPLGGRTAEPSIRVSPLTVIEERKTGDSSTNSFSVPSTAVAFPPKCDEDSLDLDEDNLDIIGEDEGGVGMMIDPNVNELEGSIGAIPILPSGKRLRLEILSTWGDNYYVGLNGIDIFDAEGRLISYVPRGSERLKTIPGVMYSRVSISAISGNPSDINVLAEYDNDPRHVTNLIESANFTRDDMHVWLAPCGEMTYEKESDCLSNQSIGKSSSNGNRITYITDGTGHTHAVIASVSVQFSDIVSISMIRIWNYNKSRTHCLRGVRRARLLLDAAVIFDGEIRIAPGTLESAESCSEVILFSTNMEVLAKVAECDRAVGYHGTTKAVGVDEAAHKWIDNMNHRKTLHRPRTADTALDVNGIGTISNTLTASQTTREQMDRPTTSAIGGRSLLSESAQFMNSLQDQLRLADSLNPNTTSAADLKKMREMEFKPSSILSNGGGDKCNFANSSTFLSERDLVSAKALSLTIESTWGDLSYTGLSGLEVLMERDSIVANVDGSMIDCDPRDLSVIGRFDDVRTPDKLVNGINETTDESNFWLIPFSKGSTHRITIDLKSSSKVSGIRIWNYNKSPEDSLRGARVISVWADGSFIGQFVARIAPGCDGVHFGQTVYFKDLPRFVVSVPQKPSRGAITYISPAARQTYETPILPRGMHWKFSIYSNWGDSYYVGLDALEFLDENGEVIKVQPIVSGGDGRVLATVNLSNTANMKSLNHQDNIPALITAVPYSVQDLVFDSTGNGPEDQRVPSNLFNGINRDSSGHNSWLAPIAHCMETSERRQRGRNVLHNQKGWRKHQKMQDPHADFAFFDDNMLYVLFDYPTTVSAIRIYNYSKTPARGARDFSIEVDGRLLYMGTVDAALEDSKYNMALPDSKNTLGACTIVFTNDPKIVKFEKDKVQYCGATDQDVLHIDERKVMIRSKGMFDKPSPTTEGVVTDVQKRPMTAISRP